MRYYIVNKKDLTLKVANCDAVERPEDVTAGHAGLIVYIAGEDDDWTTYFTSAAQMLRSFINDIEDRFIYNLEVIRKKREALTLLNKADDDTIADSLVWSTLAKTYQKTI